MNNYGLRVEYVEYSVKKGDQLYAIAKMFNTTVSELIDINMLTSNTLFPGQVLLVPKKAATDSGYDFYIYNTVNDDTIEKIADKENVDPVLLGLYNDFGKLKLAANQQMTIPKSNVYTVRNDDTVDSVLAATNRSAIELLRANASTWLKSGTKIYL